MNTYTWYSECDSLVGYMSNEAWNESQAASSGLVSIYSLTNIRNKREKHTTRLLELAHVWGSMSPIGYFFKFIKMTWLLPPPTIVEEVMFLPLFIYLCVCLSVDSLGVTFVIGNSWNLAQMDLHPISGDNFILEDQGQRSRLQQGHENPYLLTWGNFQTFISPPNLIVCTVV